MAHAISVVAFPTTDLQKAKEFYNTFLGTEPYADTDYYVGYRLDSGLEIGLDPNGKAVITYVDVDDIKAQLQVLKDAGGNVVMDVTDVAQGLLIAQVEVQGSILGLRQKPTA